MASTIRINTFSVEIQCMKEKPYECHICEEVFPAKALLLYYFKMLIGENPYEKLMYERSLQQVSRFLSHLITHDLEKSRQITLNKTCGDTSNTKIDDSDQNWGKGDGEWHATDNTSDHECDYGIDIGDQESVNIDQECINSDSKESNLWTQVLGKGQRSWSSGNYKCNQCDNTFPKKHILYKHIKSNHGERPFVCSICSKAFASSILLKVHHKRVHSGEKPHLKCDTCDKRFWVRSALRQHARTHIRKEEWQRPHKCDVCEKTFNEKKDLLWHKKIHTEEKSHQCTYCGKFFMHSGALSTHIKIHTQDKPYICDHCGRGFITNQSLSFHLDTHSVDRTKSYQCDICSKFFYSERHVKRHKTIHTRGKPHKCNYCDMSFTTKYGCTRHERKHTGEKPYRCMKCDKYYSRSRKCCGELVISREEGESKDLITPERHLSFPTGNYEVSVISDLF